MKFSLFEMNRIFITTLCLLAFVSHSDLTLGQKNRSGQADNDILFNIPSAIMNDITFQPGLEILAGNTQKIVDNMIVIDFLLKYQLGGQEYFFYFDQHDPKVDYIIPQPAGKSMPRTALNIFFAGLKPSDFKGAFYFSTYKFPENPDLMHFFQDMAYSLSEPFHILNPDATYLYLLRLKQKTGKIYNEKVYNKYRSTIQLRSRYLLVFWDSLACPVKPGILKECEVTDAQLLFADIAAASQIVENPLIEEETRVENHSQAILPSPPAPFFNDTAVNNNEPVLPPILPDSSVITMVHFVGTYPDSLKLSYEIYNISGKKTMQIADSPVKEGIIVRGNLPAYPLFNEFIKVVIIKPKGYNIYSSSESSEINWKESEYYIKIRDKSPVQLQIQKIPSFDFFYLDVSTLKKRNIAISDIAGKLENISKSGDSYYLYVSDYERPLEAKDSEAYNDILREASNMNSDPPTPNIDIANISKALDWPTILKANKEIRIHFYLPKSTYELCSKTLIVDFLYKIANRRWEVYIYSDAELKPIVPANNNYHYINMLKP
jgi:hypothetical protein